MAQLKSILDQKIFTRDDYTLDTNNYNKIKKCRKCRYKTDGSFRIHTSTETSAKKCN